MKFQCSGVLPLFEKEMKLLKLLFYNVSLFQRSKFSNKVKILIHLIYILFFQLIAGFRSLPSEVQTVDLGLTSLSALGAVGVTVEVALIGYLLVTSIVGLYTIPFVRRIKPVRNGTTLTHIILNCGLFVILSSALPLLSKILGEKLLQIVENERNLAQRKRPKDSGVLSRFRARKRSSIFQQRK